MDINALLATVLETAGVDAGVEGDKGGASLRAGLAMMLLGCSLTLPIRRGEVVLPPNHEVLVVSWAANAAVPLILSVQGDLGRS
jgi:thiamine phosphate synthase YjbQ (UPF0047 family)